MIIIKILLSLGNHATGQYMPSTCEWIDGKRADMIYSPIMPPSNLLPPIIIEVQNVVDELFMHRLQKYCNHVYETFNIKPIALTICVKSIREVFTNDYYDTEKGEFFKQLPCQYWAQQHLILTPSTIANHLHEPLHPMVALEYVFTEQQCSLIGLEYRDDPTVKLLYAIAKQTIDHEIRIHDATIDVFMDVCNQTKTQFERIIEAINEDVPSSKRAIDYARAGLVYMSTCLYKYQQQSSSTSATALPPPPDLPNGVTPTAGRQVVEVLQSIEPQEKKRDMDVVDEFVTAWMRDHKRMDWKKCFNEGRTNGYYKNYKDARSLSITYHQVKKGSPKSKRGKKNTGMKTVGGVKSTN